MTNTDTPPADDVREALTASILPVVYGMQETADRLANAVLSAPGIEVRPRGTVTDADGSNSMGRFAFDGAEGIAFHIYSDEEHEECLAEVMFDDMPVLVAFLRHSFPGLFS